MKAQRSFERVVGQLRRKLPRLMKWGMGAMLNRRGWIVDSCLEEEHDSPSLGCFRLVEAKGEWLKLC